MSNILEPRLAFMPFEYEWAYEYWLQQQNAHWMFHEINMQSDIKDWHENVTLEEKSVVGNILKGFAQTETAVNDYWSQYVTRWFGKPEVKMMAVAFASMETIHAKAYAYLNEILGLDDFAAFMQDEATMNKLETLINVNPNDTSLDNIARSIALFSACAEGIQLFSSFAVLLSFRKSNRFKGVGQQMIFSVKDESLHSEAGCKLFRVLMDENPTLRDDTVFQKSIYDGVHFALESEFHYIDKIFEMGDLECITKPQLKNFMCDRANRKLTELGLNSGVYGVDQSLLQDMKWFYQLVSGEIQTDFFDNKETGYAKPGEDWNEDLF